MSKLIEEATKSYKHLVAGVRSVQLGTVDESGRPNVSYAPTIIEEDRSLYVYVSELSGHTSNLMRTKITSAMLIEDEAGADHLFARRRITYQCQVEEVERESEAWSTILDRMEQKLGEIIKSLRQMEDFHLIRLMPQSGRLVVGFGQAFNVSGEKMEILTHIGGSAQGHRRGHRKKETTTAAES